MNKLCASARQWLVPTMIGIGMLAATGSAVAQTFEIATEGDFGNSHPNYPASNATDGNTNFSSRWAATYDGGSANLFVDLGSAKTVDDVGIAWGTR